MEIRSLGELLDSYHAHKASKLHDKIYALLGMRSDSSCELEKYSLIVPNYNLRWSTHMASLLSLFSAVKSLLRHGITRRQQPSRVMAPSFEQRLELRLARNQVSRTR